MSQRNIDRYSADTQSHYRPTIDRLSTDHRPTIDRLLTDYRPTIDRLSTDCRPLYRPTVDRYIDRLSTAISTAMSTDISVDITHSKQDPILLPVVSRIIQQEELMKWHPSGVTGTRIRVIGLNLKF